MSKNAMDHVVLTDDSGTGTDGTILNNSLFDQIQDNVDTALQQVVQAKTGAYTILVTDDMVKVTSGTFSLDVYTAVGNSGRELEVANIGTGVVTIDPNSTQTIGALSTWTLRPNQSIKARSDGANWIIVSLSYCQSWTEELMVPIAAFRPHDTGGCGALESILLSSGRYAAGCPFDATSIENAFFFYAPPRSWNLGTFTFEPYGFNTAGGSGAIVLQMAAIAAGDNESKDTAVGTFQTSTDTILAAKNQAVGPVSAAVTSAGTPVVSDGIRFVLQRDPTAGGDTYASDYYVELVKIRLTMIAVSDD